MFIQGTNGIGTIQKPGLQLQKIARVLSISLKKVKHIA